MIPTGAKLLADARINHERLVELPPGARPQTTDEAYACQAGVVRQLLDHYGGHVIGYKIGCTNRLAQRQLGVSGPFYGHLLSAFLYNSPARVRADQFSMRVVEPEFAFRMHADLAPGLHTRDEIAGAIEGVLPAIEIVDSRFTSWTNMGALSLISDNACNAGWVKGELLRDWRGLDLAAQAVQLFVNGRMTCEGSGAAVLGHPLNVMQWLVEILGSHNTGLKAGQYVSTGVTTGVYEAEPGDRMFASFGPVGSIELELS